MVEAATPSLNIQGIQDILSRQDWFKGITGKGAGAVIHVKGRWNKKRRSQLITGLRHQFDDDLMDKVPLVIMDEDEGKLAITEDERKKLEETVRIQIHELVRSSHLGANVDITSQIQFALWVKILRYFGFNVSSKVLRILTNPDKVKEVRNIVSPVAQVNKVGLSVKGSGLETEVMK